MDTNDILLLKGDELITIFKNCEARILHYVKLAYQLHAQNQSSLPHSSFLRFPNNEKDRIIALPAYLGGEIEVAGIKWIASFPDNLSMGMERASAVLLLNSTQTGRPKAIMESSVISAKRTAASAALAAHCLQGKQLLTTVGIIGCGLINFEIVRFILAIRPEIETLLLYDLNSEKAEKFKYKCQEIFDISKIKITDNYKEAFVNSSVISLATTATKPHIFDIPKYYNDKIILHISLRDLSPEIILSADNIVDDIDHVCRAQTSIHLTEQLTENRDFIRCTIGDILNGIAPPRQEKNKIAIFSPFGLGVLDLALGQLAYKLAIEQNQGTTIKSFLPIPWLEREEN